MRSGEEFADGESRFDFSPDAIRRSVERSLRRLGRERLELLLLHSDGDDTRILVEEIRPPFGFERVPVAANGAVLLWNGALWYSYADGGTFVVRRPSGLVGLSTFSATGMTTSSSLFMWEKCDAT